MAIQLVGSPKVTVHSFNFSLDSFQTEALYDCIQAEIANLFDAKLNHIGSQPHIDHINERIKYMESIRDIMIKGQSKITV